MTAEPDVPWRPDFAAAPAFAAVRAAAAPLAGFAAWPTVAELDAALRAGLAIAGVRLVAAVPTPRRRGAVIEADELYEVRIARRGEIATRARSWHDLLNALAWASFPASKRALTERLAAAQLARLPAGATRLPGARSRAHDRLALIDEGGVVVLVAGAATLAGADALLAAVAAGAAAAVVFGHAVLEHELSGSRTVRGLPIVVPVAAVPADLAARLAAADAGLATRLDVEPPPWSLPITAALFS